MEMGEYGQKVIITKGRLRGETGVTEGGRTSANYESMIYVRRDNPKARNKIVQVIKHWLKFI